MKKVVVLLAFAVALCADGDWYAGAKVNAGSISTTRNVYANSGNTGKYNLDKDEVEKGYSGFSVVGGKSFGADEADMRLEVEFWHTGEYKDDYAKHQTNALLVNFFYDFIGESSLTPFLGAGIGLSQTKSSFAYKTRSGPSGGVVVDNDSAIGFLGHLGGGLRYALTDHFALELNARFLFGYSSSKGIDGYGSLTNYADHYDLSTAAFEAQLGARFSF